MKKIHKVFLEAPDSGPTPDPGPTPDLVAVHLFTPFSIKAG